MPVPPIILGAMKGYLADKALGAMGASPQVRAIGKAVADPRGAVTSRIADAAMNKIMELGYKGVKSPGEDMDDDPMPGPFEGDDTYNPDTDTKAFKKGGKVRKIDGCAQRGKTRGKYI
jgi:hypothetical protein